MKENKVNKEQVRAHIAGIRNLVEQFKKFADDEEHEASLPVSNRAMMWMMFNDTVAEHVEEYTIPQWGDFPSDQASEFTEDDIICNMQRYINRIKTNVRGEAESSRDLLKIAHYACILWCKRLGVEEEMLSLIEEEKAASTPVPSEDVNEEAKADSRPE